MKNKFKKYISNTTFASQSVYFFFLGSYQRFLYDMDAAKKQSIAEDEAHQQSVARLF